MRRAKRVQQVDAAGRAVGVRSRAPLPVVMILCLLSSALFLPASGVAQKGDPESTGLESDQPPVDSALRIQELQDQIEADPSDAEAYTQLGILYVKEGLFEEARSAFISALQAAPGEPSSHLNLGLVLLRMKRWQEARVPLESFNRMAPDQAQGYALLGRSFEGEGDLEQARKVWLSGAHAPGLNNHGRASLVQEIIRSYLEGAEADNPHYQELADLLEAEGDLLASPEGADLRKTLEFCHLKLASEAQDAGRNEDALAHYARLREMGSTELAAYTKPAEIELDLGAVDQARQLVEEARQKLGNAAVVDYLAGRVAEKEGDLEAAAKSYRQAAALDPDFPGVHAALGGVLAQLGDSQAAARALARAVRKGEGGAAAAYNMGVVLSKKGDFAAAIPHLKRAVELDPQLKDAYRALGTAFRKTKDYAASVRVYQQVVDHFGPDPSDLYQLAYAEAKTNQHAKAAQNYGMVVALQPNNQLAHYNLGNSLLKLGRYEKAASEFQRSLELKEDNELALYNLGLCYQKMGEYEQAVPFYERALEQKETYRSYVNLAICYKEMGDEETSDEYYRLANEIRGKRR